MENRIASIPHQYASSSAIANTLTGKPKYSPGSMSRNVTLAVSTKWGFRMVKNARKTASRPCNANARQQNRTGEIVFGVDGKIHNIRIVRLLINQIDNILDSLHDAPGFPEGKRQEKSKVSQRQLAAESRQKLYAGRQPETERLLPAENRFSGNPGV